MAEIGDVGELTVNLCESTSLTLSWTDQVTANGNSITSFQLQYLPFEPTGSPSTQTLNRNSRVATLDGLTPGRLYTVILRGVTGAGTVELDRLEQHTGMILTFSMQDQLGKIISKPIYRLPGDSIWFRPVSIVLNKA